MTDGMIKLKAHAAYYRKCYADAITPSQAAIAVLQAKALEHAIESIGALPDLAPKVSVQDAAKVLLDAHAQASNVPPSDRTPVQDDLAQMGRKRLSRIASALVAHGEG